MGNLEPARAQLVSELAAAINKFYEKTGFCVVKIEIAEGITFEIQSKEYFDQRMLSRRKRAEKAARTS